MNSKKILGIDMEYNNRAEDVENVYKFAYKNNQNLRKNTFPLRPSGALKSDLDLYFDLVNYYAPGTIPKDEFDGRVAILLESGHVLEDFIVEQYGRVHEIIDVNKRVTYGELSLPDGSIKELNGEYDFTFIDKDTGKKMLGDSKTSGDYAFRATEKPMYGRPPALPKEEHFAQLNLYMHSKEFKDQGIDTARIVYYNKNNSSYFVSEFKYNEELALKTISRFQDLIDAHHTQEQPEQEYYWGHHWKGKYSSYRTHLHDKYKLPKADREMVEVSDDEFNEVTKGSKAEAIYKFAKKYELKRIKTNSGKSCYLSLTKDGLNVRITDNSGFTSF